MNFLLKNLEHSLEETHQVVGEKLLDSQKVTSLYESERNLWVAEVDGFEIELQISPSRVKACTCECAIFQKERMCGHVAAGLLALRKHLSEKKEKATSSKKTYQKLTVNAILDQVGKEELNAFVRYYASSNRQFAMALKTRFAGVVPMTDATEKYRQVIDPVLKSARNKNDKISVPGAKQLLAAGFDLLGQANDALALEHYVDCWSILNVLIEKIVPIVNRTDFETAQFLQFSESCFDLVGRLAESPIPPDMKSDVWGFLLEIASRPIYRGFDVAVYIFNQLLPLADDKNKALSLLQVVDQELKSSRHLSENYQQELHGVKLVILQKRGFGKMAKAYYQEVLSAPDQVLFVVSTAVKIGQFDIAKMLATKGLAASGHDMYQYRLKVLLLDIAVVEKDWGNVVKWSQDCFIATGNVKYVRLCKQFFKGDWRPFLLRLADQVSAADPSQQNEFLANLYGEEKCIVELSGIARQEGTVDFLMKYDRYFLPEHANQLYSLYVEILDKYFTHHFGIKPTKKMLALFDHLRQLDAARLVDKLAAFVRKKHPERLELAMELMAL